MPVKIMTVQRLFKNPLLFDIIGIRLYKIEDEEEGLITAVFANPFKSDKEVLTTSIRHFTLYEYRRR